MRFYFSGHSDDILDCSGDLSDELDRFQGPFEVRVEDGGAGTFLRFIFTPGGEWVVEVSLLRAGQRMVSPKIAAAPNGYSVAVEFDVSSSATVEWRAGTGSAAGAWHRVADHG